MISKIRPKANFKKMKRYSIVRIIICLSVIAAGSTGYSQAQTKAIKKVSAAVEKLKRAMVDAEVTMLEKIASDYLSYGHSGGQVQTKAEFVQSISSGASDFVNIDLSNQTIHVAGNTAIVRHTFSASTMDKGKEPGAVKLSILLVCVKASGGWQLIARQAVKVM